MSERDKQQIYQAAVTALSIINQRNEELRKYKIECFTYAENNPGNFSFHFNMDFLKVRSKLMLGYIRNCYAQSQTRKWQISSLSLKIADETGASYQEIRDLFLLLMNKHIIF